MELELIKVRRLMSDEYRNLIRKTSFGLHDVLPESHVLQRDRRAGFAGFNTRPTRRVKPA